MNKIFLYFFVFLLVVSLVFAVGEGVGVGAIGSDNQSGLEDSGNPEAGNENTSGYEHQVGTQTMNQGEDSQLQVQATSEFGSTIRAGNAEANTSMKMYQGENGRTFAELSNGMNAEIKIMPNTASEKALEILGAKCEERGCEIELKEVGKGEETKAAYEVKAKKEVKVLGFIKSQMRVRAQIDAETGEVIKTRNSWWGFLAKKK